MARIGKNLKITADEKHRRCTTALEELDPVRFRPVAERRPEPRFAPVGAVAPRPVLP